jgi:hypothetical protein
MNDNNDNLPSKELSEGQAHPANLTLHPDFGDVESMLNMREWLESCVKAKGATVDGGGMGMGQADIDITLEGHQFNISIKPRIKG